MILYDNKFRKVHGYEEGQSDSIDTESLAKAAAYKKNNLKTFISLNQNQIEYRLGGDRYYVTRKYDGEYAIIIFEHGQAVTVNRSGRVRRGIPCIDQARDILISKGIRQAIIPAEIYVEDSEHRTRVNDLISTLADKDRIGNLQLAVFDILELDNKPYRSVNYKQTYDLLQDIFGGGVLCRPVEMQIAGSSSDVIDIYHQWVDEQGSEGLVVRSDLPLVYKIKPRHSIDVVVIGFTEGTGDHKGEIRTVLTALMPEQGKYQVIGKTGGGFPDSLRKEKFREFSKKVIDSNFVETDSNHVAFRMIRPDTIMEITINDVLFETGSGAITNEILVVENGVYRLHGTVEGISFVAPVFARFRDDKQADAHDARLTQIDNFIELRPGELLLDPVRDIPASELISREVYKKTLGSKIMVQKYMIWKTNKELSGDYPAYVFHYTNFSSQRKEPLQREVRISDSYDQILRLQLESISENVKKGWEHIDHMMDGRMEPSRDSLKK